MTDRRPQSISGRYFEPNKSKSRPALLSRSGSRLEIAVDGGLVGAYSSDPEISSRVGNIPRRVTLSDGSVFETSDNDGLELFFGLDRHLSTRFFALEKRSRWTALVAVVCIALVFCVYRYGMPVAARFAASATPAIVSSAIDRGALETLDKVLFEASVLEVHEQERIDALFRTIIDTAGKDTNDFRLLFRDGGAIGANAFALPGGSIVITDQIVQLTENDDELAGVLGHELAHVVEQHSLQQIYRAVGWVIVAGLVAGDSGQLVEEAVAQVGALQSLSYSRAFETSADIYSARLMHTLGRNPLAFIDLLERVTLECGPSCDHSSLLSSHPGTVDRRRDIEQLEFVDP
ncbi:M48 family metallopeptidase [Hoeflea sp. WL0058]|uniref:M48 family metallopeptidase n=1 Tax=Flavimaribacter sediminis TaxID=2865987 RepID=A0AAE2ZFQ2_9HYPH|nr:M48 family metallopeptidase [Flavimaribacter sediminis]MBW8635733.1 M48 family metallopeptidase [Flavimaribacter sediminis]